MSQNRHIAIANPRPKSTWRELSQRRRRRTDRFVTRPMHNTIALSPLMTQILAF
jgi:hypothetical protein